MAGRLAPYWRHLRLPFQLTLAPIFLWGALLSGGRVTAATVAAFVALHLFLYPAATAFNSWYDRDEGPVGGMAEPPPVPERLLAFALALAGIGVLLALAGGATFVLLYALIAGWTAAYSHPAARWKGSPWKSAAAIGLGQGGLGFAAGWAAAAPLEVSAAIVIGAASAALTALGLYPATQVFQVEEDAARGDWTLAVALGPATALRFGSFCLALGGGAAAWLVAERFGPAQAAVLAFGYAALVAMQERLARAVPRLDRIAVWRASSRLTNVATAAFLGFLAWLAAG